MGNIWIALVRIIYYIADLPVTRRWLLTNKSDNIAVPYALLRSLILLLGSLSFAFFLTRSLVEVVKVYNYVELEIKKKLLNYV